MSVSFKESKNGQEGKNKRSRDCDIEPDLFQPPQQPPAQQYAPQSALDEGNSYYGRPDRRGYEDLVTPPDGQRRDKGRGDYYSDSRERDDGYYGRGDYRQDDEWKCLECRTWNYNEDEYCDRCRRPKSHVRPRLESYDSASSRRQRSLSHGSTDHHYRKDDEQEEEVDEFGRSAAARPAARAPKWPPAFESDGASYVFDARSGMFYEAMSDFFYDPKTKLYYGNKDKIYYTHCAGQSPPFQKFSQPQQEATAAVAVLKNPPAEEKKTIAIKLKSKVLPGKKSAKKAAKVAKETKKLKIAPLSVQPFKEQDAIMAKWSEREKEKLISTQAEKKSTKEPKTIAKTTSGQPICLLCRRKFANLEKLQQHEKLSALHKENLAKKKAADEKTAADEAKLKQLEPSSSEAYRDRASERRTMHGPESVLPALPVVSRDVAAASAPEKADVVRPEDSLGASNIGNKMLQKLGWKSGATLGRQADGPHGAGNEQLQSTIVKDWEKIESLAASGHSQTRTYGPRSTGKGIGH